MSNSSPRQIGVVLVNLGTPDAATPTAVRAYLREFLSDGRVIEIPKPLWWLILNCFVLPFRPKRVAKLYASIWQNGDSPMRTILAGQAQALGQRLQAQRDDVAVSVMPAMNYGRPSLTAALDRLLEQGIEHIVVLPLFPQYSATSTAPVYDVIQRWCGKQRNLPALSVIKDYFDHPDYIGALANSVREHWGVHGRAEKLLMSFHGIPQPYADKGDPYADRCRVTARRVAQALGLGDQEWAFSFQSRFGKQEWVKPYTDALLKSWAESGTREVQVLCPAFSADCLETLEEIAEQNREIFLHAGGANYQYIPALNLRDDHLALFEALVAPHIKAHLA